MLRFKEPKRKFLEIKTIAPLALVLSLIIFGFLWASNKINNPKTISFKKENAFNNQNKIDSDNDGLYDWQEVLFNTDKNNPDTDRDGTKDGDEIKQNRDPLKPGPNDKIENKDLSQISKDFKFKKPENLTDKFALALAKQIIENTNNPQELLDISEKDLEKKISKEKLANDLLTMASKDFGNLFSFKEIKDEDLIIVNDSIKAKKEYFNQYNKITKDAFNNISEEEIKNLFENLQNQNPQNFFQNQKILQKIIASYKKAIKYFYFIKVPESLKELHKEKIKLMIVTKTIFEKISDYENDPFGALIAIKTFDKIGSQSKKINNQLEEIAKNL